jgi:hypothetical protein
MDVLLKEFVGKGEGTGEENGGGVILRFTNTLCLLYSRESLNDIN